MKNKYNMIKTYSQLDKLELNALTFSFGNDKNDYVNYQVRYNKQGNLLGVSPYEFNQSKIDKIAKTQEKLDIIDYCNLKSKVHNGAYYQARHKAQRLGIKTI